jgi:hypothetical protein
MADPSPAQIHTLTLPNGLHFRLAGLHVMTKELDHWVWITLWWSPEPDDDFGADRPASIAALGGPWGHYKMCVVTAFEEGRSRARRRVRADPPDARGRARGGPLGTGRAHLVLEPLPRGGPRQRSDQLHRVPPARGDRAALGADPHVPGARADLAPQQLPDRLLVGHRRRRSARSAVRRRRAVLARPALTARVFARLPRPPSCDLRYTKARWVCSTSTRT